VSERALGERIKRVLRPMKARAVAKAKRLAPDFVAAAARDEVGVVKFRGVLAQTLLRERPARKARELKPKDAR